MKTNNLINTDRIPLSEQRQNLFLVFCIFTSLLTLSVSALIFFLTKSLYISGAVFILLTINLAFIFSKLRKHIASGYIRNNMVILKMLNERNYVLEFRCIKSVKTRTMFGYKMSVIHFKFDGNKYHCYLLGTENGKHGGDIIRKAKKAYFKGKKASHKPGSVHSAS